MSPNSLSKSDEKLSCCKPNEAYMEIAWKNNNKTIKIISSYSFKTNLTEILLLDKHQIQETKHFIYVIRNIFFVFKILHTKKWYGNWDCMGGFNYVCKECN